MKKAILLASLILVAMAGPAFGAWTLTASVEQINDNYLHWKIVCTSDGNALSATDVLTLSPVKGFLGDLKGSSLMTMYVSPGTGAVIPNGTVDITLSNHNQRALWADTAISKDAGSWHKLWDDIGIFPPVSDKLYLTVNDIGDAGDQVTLEFLSWVEK